MHGYIHNTIIIIYIQACTVQYNHDNHNYYNYCKLQIDNNNNKIYIIMNKVNGIINIIYYIICMYNNILACMHRCDACICIKLAVFIIINMAVLLYYYTYVHD